MERRVVVLGSGAAGVSAAMTAHALGASVTLVRGRPGATSLTSGALDGSLPTDERVLAAVDALAIYALGACTLATSAGTLRSAAGRDRALCDLAATSGAVLVARVAHPAWDADALAASYAELDGRRDYIARDVGLVFHTSERVMTHTALAALHDDDARLSRVAERLRASLADGGTFGAVLLPPWLGLANPRALALSERVGLPCGEVLCAIEGPAGVRFERARDKWLRAKSIATVADHAARRVSSSPDGCRVTVGASTIEADAVVLATGGLLGGGISYTPGDAAHARGTPPPARSAFALTYDARVVLGRDGRPLPVPGSLFGIPPETLTWPYADAPTLERIGILADATLCAGTRIYVAGDALADSPRTMLAAFESGVAAARAAAT